MKERVARLIDGLADAINRWVRDQHRPFDLGGDGRGPAVCSLDASSWPCPAWLAADRRLRS